MRREIDPSIASERRRGGGSVRTRYVVHLGARTDLGDNTLAEHASNTWGLEALIESLTAGPRVKGVVFASSRLVCRIGHQPTSDEDYCPTTAYGASKAEGERIVRRAGLAVPWIIVRPTSTWGPWFGVPYRPFFENVLRGRYVHPRDIAVRKSFGFVGNTVHQLSELLRRSTATMSGQTVYMADYEPLELGHSADLIRAASQAEPVPRVPVHLPRTPHRGVGRRRPAKAWMARAAAHELPPPKLLTEMLYDVDLLRTVVPSLPYSLQEGIHHTLEWLHRHSSLPYSGASPALLGRTHSPPKPRMPQGPTEDVADG